MKNYLLDTHAFLWWMADDPRFPSTVKTRLQKATETVYFSVASLWEIILKYKLGKIHIPEPVEPYLMNQIARNRLEILTIHSHHVFAMLSLPALHRDPFDRLLIAQARSEKLVLISGDAQIKAYSVDVLW